MTVNSLTQCLVTEADAWAYLEELRWPTGAKCPRCKGTDVYLQIPRNGRSRTRASGHDTERRSWQCRTCRRQFSATVGTMMHGTKIPLRTWILVIFEMVSSKNGVAALEIQRKYGLCSRSAWFLMHRIREAMNNDLGGLFDGDVVVDETYVGGEPKNWHAEKRERMGVRPGRATHKIPVVSVIDADTGECRSAVVADVTGKTLRRVIGENVNLPLATLHTDAWAGYGAVGAEMAGHYFVDHSTGEYVSEKSIGTQKAENFFSQLKRSIDGTHHHVSREHLHRYLGEFDFRYSTRKLSDTERMCLLMGFVGGKRVTYKRVTA